MKIFTTAAFVLITALVSAGAAAQDCAPGGGLEFVCGPGNAEDLVHVPGTDWIIASGMSEGASLFLVDAGDKSWSELYPAAAPRAAHDTARYGMCPGAPDPAGLVAHGLNLRAGDAPGRATLYVVGHGAREAIEVFDIDASGRRPVVTWTGCVPMPEGLDANSVASFSDGGLVATVLVLPGRTFTEQLAGRPTGVVLEWRPGNDGFERVAGTELPGNNGIETAADDSEIFVVSSGLHTVVAYSRDNPARRLRSTERLPFTPDNLHRGPDGRLLTAGMRDDVPACGGAPGPEHTLEQLSTCPRGFMAAAIDPDTMQHSIVAEGPANPDFSNHTMVLPVGDEFWLGTFRGDRIGYGPLNR